MSSHSIRTFNPFNLQHGSNKNWHIKVQEVIYYGESRFRQALAVITKSDGRHQEWMQRCLQRELMFIMSYIGIATGVGQIVEVPIVLRSLADSLAMVSDADLPVEFNSAFIATLDVGTTEEQFWRVVKDYHLSWWMMTRQPADRQLLTAITLETCLTHYRLQRQMDATGSIAQKIIPLPPFQPSTPDADADADCSRCAANHTIAADLLGELRSLKNFASSMAELSRNKVAIATQVILKEARTSGSASASDSADISDSERRELIRQVAGAAEADLRRLQAMPPTSFKWTWGERLTKADVLDLRHFAKQRLRSGYNTSIREAKLLGEFSVASPTTPNGTARYSLVSADADTPPPATTLQFPAHFGSFHTKTTTSQDSQLSISGIASRWLADKDDAPAADQPPPSPAVDAATAVTPCWLADPDADADADAASTSPAAVGAAWLLQHGDDDAGESTDEEVIDAHTLASAPTHSDTSSDDNLEAEMVASRWLAHEDAGPPPAPNPFSDGQPIAEVTVDNWMPNTDNAWLNRGAVPDSPGADADQSDDAADSQEEDDSDEEEDDSNEDDSTSNEDEDSTSDEHEHEHDEADGADESADSDDNADPDSAHASVAHIQPISAPLHRDSLSLGLNMMPSTSPFSQLSGLVTTASQSSLSEHRYMLMYFVFLMVHILPHAIFSTIFSAEGNNSSKTARPNRHKHPRSQVPTLLLSAD
ncbi:hypothetical protein BDZ97DRAFT_1813684 [Flammula alnicola]|nr:hypothetical protein BDZ97DRAFT_1813684 [Flammula alnicola]